MLIGLEPEGLLLVADVIFWFVTEEGLVVDIEVEEDAAPVGVLWLDLSLTLFELPNQRLRRALNEVDWEVLLASSSSAAFCSFCNAWVKVDVDSAMSSGGGVSTSSASRYHFLRRVYRSHPSWSRRPSFHYFSSLEFKTGDSGERQPTLLS